MTEALKRPGNINRLTKFIVNVAGEEVADIEACEGVSTPKVRRSFRKRL